MAGYRINIRDLVYAVFDFEDDVNAAPAYEDIQKVPGTMEIGMAPRVAEGDLHGDGVLVESLRQIIGYDLTVSLNKLSLADRAKWLGHEIVEGVLVETSSDVAPFLALGFTVDLTGGGREVLWFPKCKPSPISNTIQQKTDAINYSTDSLTVVAMPRRSDGRLKYYGDTTAKDFTDTMADTFFAKVPGSQAVGG